MLWNHRTFLVGHLAKRIQQLYVLIIKTESDCGLLVRLNYGERRPAGEGGSDLNWSKRSDLLSHEQNTTYSATLDGVKANSSALIYPDGIQPNDRQTGIGSNEEQRIRNKGRLICTHTLCCGSSRAPDSSSEVWRKRSQNHSAYGVHGPLVGISIRFPVDEFLESSKCILHTIVQSSITEYCTLLPPEGQAQAQVAGAWFQ